MDPEWKKEAIEEALRIKDIYAGESATERKAELLYEYIFTAISQSLSFLTRHRAELLSKVDTFRREYRRRDAQVMERLIRGNGLPKSLL
jgi:hypothetical protein